MPIKPINHYSITANPAAYDEEAMTSLELASRTAGKVNEVVNGFNALEAQTGEAIADQNRTIDEAIEDLPHQVESSVDEHVLEGAFDAQISDYMGGLKARLDNLSKTVTPGSTTGDAELIDARTDAEGDKYTNAGGSIRGQYKKMKTAMEDFAELDSVNRNMWNPDTVVTEKYLGTDGKEYDGAANFYNTEYIPVHHGCKIVTSYFNAAVGDRPICTMRFVVAYSEDKTVLPGSGAEFTTRYEVPEGVHYIRISLQNYYFNNQVQVDCSMNGTPTPYKPYSKPSYVVKGLDEINERTYVSYHGKNRLNVLKNTYGYYVGTTGSLYENTEYCFTDLIPVTPGDNMLLSYDNNGVRTVAPMRFIAIYDKNKGLLPSATIENKTVYTVPENVYYLRVSYAITYDNRVMIEKTSDGKPTAYVEYTEPFTLPVNRVMEEVIRVAPDAEKGLSASIIKPIETKTITNDPNDPLRLGRLELSENHIIKNKIIAFSVKTDDNVASEIRVGHGYGYGSMYMVFLGTRCNVYSFTDIERRIHTETFASAISNPSGYISVDHTGKAHIFMCGDNGNTGEFTIDNWTGRNGRPFIECNSALKMSLSFYSGDYNSNVWAYGDSYFHPTSVDRWTSHLIKDGFTNIMLDGYPGANSASALTSFKNALYHGTPTHVLWCMGMNDGSDASTISPNWLTAIKEVEAICATKNITLILATIPNVATVNNTFKNNYIRESGYRYIDFAKAVEGAAWVSTDGIHPNETGATILANQVFIDFPEIIITRR